MSEEFDALDATLDSFRHYVDRIDALVERVADAPNADLLWSVRVTGEVFDVARQLGVALFFAARGVYPLLDRDLPAFPESFDHGVLKALADEVRDGLADVAAGDLRSKPVKHIAGFAQLEQAPADYMIRFALPNMIFHYTMGYGALRAAGLDIGKADFDGLHSYPDGFSF